MVDHLAGDGAGLNLTWAVRDGIVCHNGEKFEPFLRPAATPNVPERITDRACQPSTWEGCIVRYADKIAYLGRDIEDALDGGFIDEREIPERVRAALGSKNGEIINTLVLDLIQSSQSGDAVRFSEERFAIINDLRAFNYRQIYFHPRLRQYEQYCRRIIDLLFSHLTGLYQEHGRDWDRYQASPIPLDQAWGRHLRRMTAFYDTEGSPPHQPVVDYISGMTDAYALTGARQILLPEPIRFPGH